MYRYNMCMIAATESSQKDRGSRKKTRAQLILKKIQEGHSLTASLDENDVCCTSMTPRNVGNTGIFHGRTVEKEPYFQK